MKRLYYGFGARKGFAQLWDRLRAVSLVILGSPRGYT